MNILSRLIQSAVLATLLLVACIGPRAYAQTETAASARTPAQLEQLVAPIALYPDALLSQVLMASTYPLEVVAAARWAQANPSASGDALQNAMAQQTWDPSVKALTAVPQTLQMMNDKIDWTQQLGDAFLAQQSDVLDAVQRLRARADAHGYLKSTPQQKVTATPRAGGQQSSTSVPANVYAIEPTNPDEYYVPIYNPAAVYGDWPYPDYEPFYWYPPGYAFATPYGFGAAVLGGAAIWGTVNWLQNRVAVNPLRYNAFNRTNISNTNWAHNPAHRGAVPYRDRGVAQQFGNQGASAAREAFRGKADTGRQGLSKGNANARPANTGKSGSKQGARNNKAGSKQAHNKQASSNHGAGSKQAKSSKQAKGNKQARGNKQAARSKQSGGARQHAGNRQASRPSTTGQRSHGASRSAGRNFAGARGGGGRGGGGRGGRRSDIRLKHDITLLARLDNGLGLYRFVYNGGNTAYVGVLAQEVQTIMPRAVVRGRDGYLRVFYERLGIKFQRYDHWMRVNGRNPAAGRLDPIDQSL